MTDESVCLSVYSHNSNHTAELCQFFLCMLPVAMARSCSDGIVICCVAPVLWMMSCFILCCWWARIKHDVKLRRSLPGRQLDVRQLQYLVEFIRMQQWVKSAICY